MENNRASIAQAIRRTTLKGQFICLAVLALICVLAAFVAQHSEERLYTARFTPTLFFPGLEAQLSQVRSIHLTIGRGLRGAEEIVLERRAEGGFGVSARGNYPANPRLVEKFLTGMAGLQTYEPRTANSKWHGHLGLVAPEEMGSAMRITLKDASGKPMAALLAGKVPDQAIDVNGQGMIYVRRDGAAQTYLARGAFPLAQNAADYLDPAFLELKPDDIARAALWVGTDNEVVMLRPENGTDFILQQIPSGRSTRGAPIVNGTATSLATARFEDVVPADTLDFPATSPRAEFETYEGLRITLTLAADTGFLWAKLSAEAADERAVARAEMLNARLTPWAYRLPAALGNELLQTMDLLTREGEAQR